MAARKASLANAFTKGVLDPALSERIDLAHYYNGLESALNIEVFPQGGLRRRAGTTTNGQRLRRQVQPIQLTEAMLTAPNGGTLAHLTDHNAATVFTTNAVDSAAFVLAEVDFGEAVTVAFADVLGFACETGRFPNSVGVEYFDGAEWQPFAPSDAVARKTLVSGISILTLEETGVSSREEDQKLVYFEAPVSGLITNIKVTLNDALETADATVSVEIEGSPVDGGLVTIPFSGSAEGDVVEAVPTGGNRIEIGEEIKCSIGGGSTAVGTLDIELTIQADQRRRTRRFARAPGANATAQQWRVVAYDANGAGAITVADLRFLAERRAVSPVKGLSFARTAGVVYEFAVTDRNVDVYQNHVYLASIATDIDRRQVSEVSVEQSLDTLMLYHEDVESVRITRQGGNDEWNSEGAAFTNVPPLTPGLAFAGDQDEVQDVRLPNMPSGAYFVLWLEGKFTVPIVYDPSTVEADVAAALEGIGVPAGGVTAALLSNEAGFRVTFSGAAGARRWPVVFATVLDFEGIQATTEIVQRGIDVGGPLMGETNGWPRCGAFYQERQLLGGFRSAPTTFGVSRFGEPFDFLDDADPLTADLAFFGALNTDQVETIHAIFVGRHIQLFTEAAEWYVEARVLDATQPPNVLLSTRYGMKSNVPVQFADGATLFVQQGGRVLRDMVFSDVELSYKADPLSLLAPHLLTDVVDVGYRSQRSTDEGNQLFLINGDGSMAFMSLLRSQEVVAMAPWETDGKFRAAFGDVLQRVWTIVERETVLGGADLYLEKLDGSHTLDGVMSVDVGTAVSAVTGLDMHEGKDVWAWADGELVGPMLVTAGTVTLPVAASSIRVGLFPRYRMRLPRLRDKLQSGFPFRPPARIYEVELALAGTGQIDISVNGGPFRNVPLTFGDDKALDIAAEPPRDTAGVEEATPADQLERLIRALVMIPGTGEFVYSTDVITNKFTEFDGPKEVKVNMHNTDDEPDFLVSLGHARQAMPNLQNMALFVSWFGDDLRAGDCDIRPKVDVPAGGTRTWEPYDWAVQGISRAGVPRVSLHDGNVAYAGTPSDQSVVDAIKAMKAQGVAVTLTPFLVMDVPDGNGLADPYGAAEQPAYPWRGRITCHPAPGQPGSPDLTAAAGTQVDAFVGTCDPADFVIAGETVSYTGPAEWSYRRFILHYAALAAAAGGVDTFVIGSEMRELTRVRDALGSYPFVDGLVQLAADVKAIVGPQTKVTYAADWTEIAAHQTGVAGELFFHLDPLWASANIDAIGIDNYWPLADWRQGSTHLDFLAGTRSIYDRRYLQSNIEGGELYDWFYASPADRDAQVRTPITDGLGKPWVWRIKDIKSWWQNQHFNRPAGVEDASATAWVPQSKPIWFMEAGCPAVDLGANQPNVFYDPKSSESFRPYYSVGVRDERMQRSYLEALIGYYLPGQTGFDDANNPVSDLTGQRMVDVSRIYAYTWDARFHPAFPALIDIWDDGDLYETGHWLTGRVYLSTELDPDALPVGYSPELPMRDRLVTGNIRITNLRGWSRHPSIELSQSIPAPLEVRAIRYEVAHRG